MGSTAGADLHTAPSGKAASLNQAVSWIFAGDLDKVPERLRSAARQVREAFAEGSVESAEIWFTHNLSESGNCYSELSQVQSSADALIKRLWPSCQVNVSCREIGNETLERIYIENNSTVVVKDQFEFHVSGGFVTKTADWETFTTAIPGHELRDLWLQHKQNLLSANVRDYLGKRSHRANINDGIRRTASQAPQNFFTFNNGMTVLVEEFDYNVRRKLLRIKGAAIVNGAQTTGVIGSLSEREASGLSGALILTRFIRSADAEVIDQIIRFNNTQNKIEPADFRSRDKTQQRLVEEFKSVPQAVYTGARRGGSTDKIARNAHLVAHTTVAQALAAFRGSPDLAFQSPREIWENDSVYAKVFNEHVTAQHIVCVIGLLKAVGQYRNELRDKGEEERTDREKKALDFLSRRGAQFIFTAAVAACLETYVGKIENRTKVRFKANLSPAAASEEWKPFVQQLMVFSQSLIPALDESLKKSRINEESVNNFSDQVAFMLAGSEEQKQRLSSLLSVS